MDDVISRKAAIDYCYQLINVEHQQGSDGMNYGQERVNQTETILHHLEMMPSAQPEIIRCRECKYWREHKYAKETKRYIPFCGFNAIYTKSDDFCSKGKRRTE